MPDPPDLHWQTEESGRCEAGPWLLCPPDVKQTLDYTKIYIFTRKTIQMFMFSYLKQSISSICIEKTLL